MVARLSGGIFGWHRNLLCLWRWLGVGCPKGCRLGWAFVYFNLCRLQGSVEGCGLDRAFIRRQFLISNQFLEEVHIDVRRCSGGDFNLFHPRLTIVTDELYFRVFVRVAVSDSADRGEVGL